MKKQPMHIQTVTIDASISNKLIFELAKRTLIKEGWLMSETEFQNASKTIIHNLSKVLALNICDVKVSLLRHLFIPTKLKAPEIICLTLYERTKTQKKYYTKTYLSVVNHSRVRNALTCYVLTEAKKLFEQKCTDAIKSLKSNAC